MAAFRMNGRSYRSGSDINMLMESKPAPQISDEEKERRLQLYCERADAGLCVFSGVALAEEYGEIEDVVVDFDD